MTPFCLITALIFLGMPSITFWHASAKVPIHLSTTFSQSLYIFLDSIKCLCNSFFKCIYGVNVRVLGREGKHLDAIVFELLCCLLGDMFWIIILLKYPLLLLLRADFAYAYNTLFL